MENSKIRLKYKILISICSTVLAIAAVTCTLIFLFDVFRYNTGVVRSISLKANDSALVEAKITYFLSMGGYSVREVAPDEGEYIGDGMIDYNGDLGKYRVLVTFGDMLPHRSLAEQISRDGTLAVQHTNTSFKVKIAFPSDHGFILYIGSDTPIRTENVSDTTLNPIYGTIRIPIYTDQ